MTLQPALELGDAGHLIGDLSIGVEGNRTDLAPPVEQIDLVRGHQRAQESGSYLICATAWR